MDRRSISGITISGVTIRDSLSSGITIVGPGSLKGEGTLSNARLEHLIIANSGIGGSAHHDLWIRKDALGTIALVDSSIADIRSDSVSFRILGQ